LNSIWNELQSLQLPTSGDKKKERRVEGRERGERYFTCTPTLGRGSSSFSTESHHSEGEIFPVKVGESKSSENSRREFPDIYSNLRSTRKIWPENFDRMMEVEWRRAQPDSQLRAPAVTPRQKDESTQTERSGKLACRVS